MSDTSPPGARKDPSAEPGSRPAPAPDPAREPEHPAQWISMRGAAADLLRLDWLRVAVDAYMRFERHEGWILSGYIAFATLLAVFPFLIFATSLAAATIGPEQFEALTQLVFDVTPRAMAEAVQPVLEEALGRERPGLLTFAGLAAIWFSSNGVEAFRTGFDRAYQPERPRGLVVARLIAVAFVLLGAVVSILIGVLVVLAPLILRVLESLFEVSAPWGLGVLRYLIALAAFAFYLWLMHRILPSRQPERRRMWPGIVTTIVIWMLAASGFSIYLANFGRFSLTYGSLAGVIVTLLFFYISGLVIIYGAEVNAALSRRQRDAQRLSGS
jgi:membrane protein